MPTSNPTDLLLLHNRWATRNLLQACAALPTQQFHQRFEIGPGSLHDTLTHIVGAMHRWNELLAGRDSEHRPENDDPRTPQKLMALLDETADALEATVAAHPLEESVTGSRGGRTYTFTRGGVLTHVTTHGMHHRAQCLNMLRQLGADLSPSSVLEWMLTADG